MRWKLLLTAVVAIGSISLSAVEGVKQTLADRFESLKGAQDSDAASSESAAVVEGRHPEEIQQHEAAVVLATGNALTAACALLCDDEEIEAILHLTVYLAVEEGFTEHSRIADFASSYLASVLGSAGLGARAAVGVAALPGGAPVEVQLVASAKDKSAGDNAFSANKEAQDA